MFQVGNGRPQGSETISAGQPEVCQPAAGSSLGIASAENRRPLHRLGAAGADGRCGFDQLRSDRNGEIRGRSRSQGKPDRRTDSGDVRLACAGGLQVPLPLAPMYIAGVFSVSIRPGKSNRRSWVSRQIAERESTVAV